MKYAIYTDSKGFDHVVRFSSEVERQQFIEWACERPVDPEMGAAWDHGTRSAVAVPARNPRVVRTIRTDCWIDKGHGTIECERAI